MVRIGGKGMTSNRYVVLNCPTLMGNRLCYSKEIRQCADCTDCVIKQVIEKCKAKKLDIFNPSIGNEHYAIANSVLSTQILQLFDIEEINK